MSGMGSKKDPLKYALFDDVGNLLFEVNLDGTIGLLEDDE